MNQKGFVNNVVLIAILVALAGLASYLALAKKSLQVNQRATTSTTTPIQTSKSPTPIVKNGVKGSVVGHYCNGAQPAYPPPGYEPCGNEPLASFLLKIKNNVSGIEKQVMTDSTGKFQIELSPGKYTITGQVSQAILGGPTNIEVKSGVFTEVNLKFEELRS